MNEKIIKYSLKPYMAYSRSAGAIEGAVLIFAHTLREAKKYAWNNSLLREFCDDWIDLGAYLIRDKPWLYDDANQEKLSAGIPHVVDDPRGCEVCETWGGSPIGRDGVCEECRNKGIERIREMGMKIELKEVQDGNEKTL